MDGIIKGVRDIEAEYSMGNKTILILCSADDVTLFAESENDLRNFYMDL
jgi:hypothetical protein